ncbi:uncharacterized protein LOC136087433 [Hydra vulgaris]|uniref:Uncharacterized protein LOC136087433 n=1 Tax=Hydra vulgaris TaxID=6087 RepID=A0ABM4CWG3_HYDVU
MDLFLNNCDNNFNLSSSEQSSDESSEENLTSKEIVEYNANVPEIVEYNANVPEVDFLPVDRIDNGEKNKLIYHFKSHEEALECIKKYELATTTRFVVYYANKNFGQTGWRDVVAHPISLNQFESTRSTIALVPTLTATSGPSSSGTIGKF